MVRTIKSAGVAAWMAVWLLSMVSGCQKDRAAGPATKVQPPADTAVVAPQPAETPDAKSSQSAVAQEPTAQATEPNMAVPPVNLTLSFSPGQTATYKVATDAYKSVDWLGVESAKPANFVGGRTGNFVEITFTQQVREVRGDGNAVLEITIDGLKYRGLIESRTVFDFDSSRPEDANNPLAALIGKSYGLAMSAKGKVVELLAMDTVRQAVMPGSPAFGVAARLVSDEAVRERHEVPPLLALPNGLVHPGQSWSDIKSFAFGEMGLKGFERVYTLAQVQQEDGRTAIVEMKAIPSAAMAEQLHKHQTAGPLAGLFDSSDTYEGRLAFDLDGGRIREYTEQMQAEWVIADPASIQDTTAEPRGLKMGATRLHRLELIR